MVETKRCGIIAIIGLPNAGKSTLLNAVLARKLTAVSRKKQTTLQNVQGVCTRGASQLVFIDTPGVASLSGHISRSIMRNFWESVQNADLLLLVVDSALRSLEGQKKLLELVSKSAKPKILVLSKIDLIAKTKLLPLADQLNKDLACQGTYMVSAQKGKGLTYLQDKLAAMVPEGDHLYQDQDLCTDLTYTEWAEEMTREAVLNYVHEEVPYLVKIKTEQWEVKGNWLVVKQLILVDNQRHSGIIIGKNGELIRQICRQARTQISRNLDQPVRLYLKVKLKPAPSKRDKTSE